VIALLVVVVVITRLRRVSSLERSVKYLCPTTWNQSQKKRGYVLFNLVNGYHSFAHLDLSSDHIEHQTNYECLPCSNAIYAQRIMMIIFCTCHVIHHLCRYLFPTHSLLLLLTSLILLNNKLPLHIRISKLLSFY
jgi:hypothetical protein